MLALVLMYNTEDFKGATECLMEALLAFREVRPAGTTWGPGSFDSEDMESRSVA